jgi:hypothetical protein
MITGYEKWHTTNSISKEKTYLQSRNDIFIFTNGNHCKRLEKRRVNILAESHAAVVAAR